jgi:hypothetical protein
MAELMAAYSPPIPAPVKNRQTKKYIGFIENAVATRYTVSVIRNSFLRPIRSAR